MRNTQYPELGFGYVSYDCWRFIDKTTGHYVGPCYKCVTELMADIRRFAAEFGCKV